MTKRQIITIVIAFVATSAWAQEQKDTIDQSQFVTVYDYECRTLNDEGTPVVDSMQIVVQVGRTVTKSMPLSAYKEMDMYEENDIMAAYQEAFMHMPTVWTGWPGGKSTVREFIFPHEFEGYEPIPEIVWTLLEDTLTIRGYHCQNATCKFRGVEWQVSYTEEIPSSAGPWRLNGLPGLIVRAESEAHMFCLAELRQESSPITAPENKPDVQSMTYAKLLKHRNDIFGNRQYAKNPTYYVPDIHGSINHMEVMEFNNQQFIFVNGYPLLSKAHVYQPLELE